MIMHFYVILEVPYFLVEFGTAGDFRHSARSPLSPFPSSKKI